MTQLAGVRGFWRQTPRSGITSGCPLWFIDGWRAVEWLDGGRLGRISPFQEASGWMLLWGDGNYVLDLHFSPGSDEATWWQVEGASGRSAVAFTWRLQPELPLVVRAMNPYGGNGVRSYADQAWGKDWQGFLQSSHRWPTPGAANLLVDYHNVVGTFLQDDAADLGVDIDH